eukprot:7050916-Alexandrium_andersonii.AAC.1
MASRRGPKGPLSPLPCVWWCANCHAGAHSAKNLFGTKCRAAGQTSEGVKLARAQQWQRRVQLFCWSQASAQGKRKLRAAMSACNPRQPEEQFWTTVDDMSSYVNQAQGRGKVLAALPTSFAQ